MPTIWNGLQTLWNGLLDWTSQVITPNWNDVIGWLPSLLVALLVVALLGLAYPWFAGSRINRSRVPRPLTTGAPPPGVHMPGPSVWPFVLPVGALFLLAGLVVHPGRAGSPTVDPTTGAITPGTPASLADVFNLPLLGLGLLILLVGIAGWYRDAGREWQRVEHPDLEAAAPRPALAAGEKGLPPGVHLPGPSPWPFFAPVALGFVLFGLVFSGWLALGGVVMAIIAIAGWYRDAGREYRQVEAGHAPEPVTRDPERAFPKALVGIYASIAVAAVLLTAAPQLIAIANAKPTPAPSATPAGSGGAVSDHLTLSAKNVLFSTSTLTAPANQPFTISFTNDDAVPHNVAIFQGSDATGTNVFRGTVFAGPGKTMDYQVKALPAGTYYFHCDVHPTTMYGTLTVK